MNKNQVSMLFVAAVLALVVLGVSRLQSVQAQAGGGEAVVGPHYTVVETQGHNLIVTDNHKNELFFYTIDQDKEIGSELKLRGRIDLNHVGKPVLKPITHKADGSAPGN